MVWGQNYITPATVTTLSPDVEETSGLLMLNGELWTHNDSGDDPVLYQLDPFSGEVVRTVEVTNADNEDWEDITMDETYVYIGDIGNNEGSRTDLKIYRVLQADLAVSDEVEADEISYHYSDQVSFEPSYHNTNFDCEAMVHHEGQLYLFTKNWLDFKTNCYVLPKTPGDHEAELLSSFESGCLVSGATMVPASGAMVLIGYTTSGGSFNWVFDGFSGDDFFGGTSAKLIWTVLSQIEGVCDAGGNDIYISSEEFGGFLDPTLYHINLNGFTTGIGAPALTGYRVEKGDGHIRISRADGAPCRGTLELFSITGSLVASAELDARKDLILAMPGGKGLYLITIREGKALQTVKVAFP